MTKKQMGTRVKDSSHNFKFGLTLNTQDSEKQST